MNNYRNRLRAIARAYIQGDFYAKEYHRALRDYVMGYGKQIWAKVALHDCLRHLKVF